MFLDNLVAKADAGEVYQRIKMSPFLRLLVYPYGVIIKRKRLKDYLKTDNPQKLRRYKDIHKNKRCFIVGNGPSLIPGDLDLLCDEICFASNRIFGLFNKTKWRPTYYVSVDTDVLYKEANLIAKIDCKEKFINITAKDIDVLRNNIYICEGVRFTINLHNNRKSYISEDISKEVCQGGSVTFSMIQIAIYMGFKEIYLIGQDFSTPYQTDKLGFIHKTEASQDHFDNGGSFKKTFLRYHSLHYGFEQAKKYCDTHGIVIKNVTRGGKLEVFERDTLEHVLHCDDLESREATRGK